MHWLLACLKYALEQIKSTVRVGVALFIAVGAGWLLAWCLTRIFGFRDAIDICIPLVLLAEMWAYDRYRLRRASKPRKT
jgi:hypothetical protein